MDKRRSKPQTEMMSPEVEPAPQQRLEADPFALFDEWAGDEDKQGDAELCSRRRGHGPLRTDDLFDFWRTLPVGTKVHPDDRAVFDRISRNQSPGHGFKLECLPSPYAGPLRTAPIVFLYLSAGWTARDSGEADAEAAQARQWAQWQGDAPIPTQADHPSGWQWWESRTRFFGDLSEHRTTIAFLNISAYHSEAFTDHALLAALPSCRLAINWAQSVLFAQAEAGERVVICLRSAAFWGLTTGRKYGSSLFAPEVTRAGHMLRQGKFPKLREEILSAVQVKLGR